MRPTRGTNYENDRSTSNCDWRKHGRTAGSEGMSRLLPASKGTLSQLVYK
ncbi:MAG: hypothetical protein PUQ00_27725 [Nostoc sp. S13]|nr:hypothetical protein [Nostoc sp. S13]